MSNNLQDAGQGPFRLLPLDCDRVLRLTYTGALRLSVGLCVSDNFGDSDSYRLNTLRGYRWAIVRSARESAQLYLSHSFTTDTTTSKAFSKLAANYTSHIYIQILYVLRVNSKFDPFSNSQIHCPDYIEDEVLRQPMASLD